jgi:hypothetical protein
MGNKQFGEAIRIWFPAILAGISLVVEMALNLFGSNIHVAVWLAVLLLIIQIVILQKELIEAKSQNPNIVFDGFKLERPFHLFRGVQATKEILERYYVMFRNTRPAGKAICDTKPIHAIISFYNTNCEILESLSHEEPFWLDRSGPPWQRGDDFSIIIKASSKPEGLCLVVRQQGKSDLFVFCDRSYISNFRTLEPFQESLRLPLHKFYIRVQIKSENVDMNPLWISVTNRGERKQPLLKKIESPCKGLE